ncbi:serine aminopeptidase S33 family [Hasllibacter halocynthiae]|uniref:Palmitoyl-protein thioesterase ABHD10, mitochondrial n=1 Tax=Hasllibacter halocynthiae TaxID=595589 RepID=A0A2T0X6T0_9RHOB|nr:alpha/beta hydrolase [Hasllibacter halocynthiae]PRY94660.1 serine aminopeptidase S33 family [Hasllibacter halocynthiae]
MPDYLDTPQERRIAYERTEGTGPPVLFLGGFRSDMQGGKAIHLEDWARRTGRAFLRFDYSGHGESEGRFEDGTIGQWAEDAEAALGLVDGRAVLVGSSMGGWIALLLARRAPERVHGMVLVAPAPDFTEQGLWNGFDDLMRAKLMREGRVAVPSDYGDPYMITKALIEDGRRNLVMDAPLEVPGKLRMLLGTADTSVPVEWGTDLLAHVGSADARLTLVKDAGHRLSEPHELGLIAGAVEDVT